jgi:FkbM family methyltransferase
LYESFKTSRFELFEPMKHCEPHLQEVARRYNAKYHLVAAGAKTGTTQFTVRADDPGASSVYGGGPGQTSEISVPMVRLDEVLRREDLGQSALLKVDVEGFELQVIEGCTGIIEGFEVVILETRFFKYADGMADFYEVVACMHRLGFVVYDMLDGSYRPQDSVLDLIDLVFVKENGFLRRKISKVWSPTPQRV